MILKTTLNLVAKAQYPYPDTALFLFTVALTDSAS
jgi:hypothetical protein